MSSQIIQIDAKGKNKVWTVTVPDGTTVTTDGLQRHLLDQLQLKITAVRLRKQRRKNTGGARQ